MTDHKDKMPQQVNLINVSLRPLGNTILLTASVCLACTDHHIGAAILGATLFMSIVTRRR